MTEDNNKFLQEIDDWDKEQARKAMGPGDADCTITGETKPGITYYHVLVNFSAPNHKSWSSWNHQAITNCKFLIIY